MTGSYYRLESECETPKRKDKETTRYSPVKTLIPLPANIERL